MQSCSGQGDRVADVLTVTLDTNLFYDAAHDREGCSDFWKIVDLARRSEIALFYTATTDFEVQDDGVMRLVTRLGMEGILHEDPNAGPRRDYMPGGPDLLPLNDNEIDAYTEKVWPQRYFARIQLREQAARRLPPGRPPTQRPRHLSDQRRRTAQQETLNQETPRAHHREPAGTLSVVKQKGRQNNLKLTEEHSPACLGHPESMIPIFYAGLPQLRSRSRFSAGSRWISDELLQRRAQ